MGNLICTAVCAGNATNVSSEHRCPDPGFEGPGGSGGAIIDSGRIGRMLMGWKGEEFAIILCCEISAVSVPIYMCNVPLDTSEKKKKKNLEMRLLLKFK